LAINISVALPKIKCQCSTNLYLAFFQKKKTLYLAVHSGFIKSKARKGENDVEGSDSWHHAGL
jgi:hypothetical protein